MGVMCTIFGVAGYYFGIDNFYNCFAKGGKKKKRFGDAAVSLAPKRNTVENPGFCSSALI